MHYPQRKAHRKSHPRAGSGSNTDLTSADEDASLWGASLMDKMSLLGDADARGRSVEHYYDALVTTNRYIHVRTNIVNERVLLWVDPQA